MYLSYRYSILKQNSKTLQALSNTLQFCPFPISWWWFISYLKDRTTQACAESLTPLLSLVPVVLPATVRDCTQKAVDTILGGDVRTSQGWFCKKIHFLPLGPTLKSKALLYNQHCWIPQDHERCDEQWCQETGRKSCHCLQPPRAGNCSAQSMTTFGWIIFLHKLCCDVVKFSFSFHQTFFFTSLTRVLLWWKRHFVM